jgi:hypothetical protein
LLEPTLDLTTGARFDACAAAAALAAAAVGFDATALVAAALAAGAFVGAGLDAATFGAETFAALDGAAFGALAAVAFTAVALAAGALTAAALRVGDFAAGLPVAVALEVREEGGLLAAALVDAGLVTTGFAGLGRELAVTDRDDVAALLAPLAVAGRAAALTADAATGDLPATLGVALTVALAGNFAAAFFSV